MKELTVELSNGKNYPITIKRGILNEIQNYLDGQKRYFIVTNATIASIYTDFLKNFENVIVIKDGEEFKNFETFEYIITKLLEFKIERSDCIIAFGGGVVGDLTGFCAASVLRGVDYIQIPTTLLSQVDSSVGGKTGFNHALGKNLIGAFKQPKMVIIDPDTLKTLDYRQIKTGLGEVLKYSFIENTIFKESNIKSEKANFFSLLSGFLSQNNLKEELDKNWEEIIFKSVFLKAAVVSKDEKEKGLRAILNFGHTFGHAIEKITNFKKYTHGECVAAGMVMAFKAALLSGFIDEEYYNCAKNLIYGYDLILHTMKNFDKEKIYEAMKSDKKVNNSKIRLVLPVNRFEVQLFDDIKEPLIKDSLL